jgi:hypothetical protein
LRGDVVLNAMYLTTGRKAQNAHPEFLDMAGEGPNYQVRDKWHGPKTH